MKIYLIVFSCIVFNSILYVFYTLIDNEINLKIYKLYLNKI